MGGVTMSEEARRLLLESQRQRISGSEVLRAHLVDEPVRFHVRRQDVRQVFTLRIRFVAQTDRDADALRELCTGVFGDGTGGMILGWDLKEVRL